MRPTNRRSYPILERAIRADLREWTTPRELSDRLQLWTVPTVRCALRGMTERGECEVSSRPLKGPLISVNLYRLRARQEITE